MGKVNVGEQIESLRIRALVCINVWHNWAENAHKEVVIVQLLFTNTSAEMKGYVAERQMRGSNERTEEMGVVSKRSNTLKNTKEKVVQTIPVETHSILTSSARYLSCKNGKREENALLILYSD